MTILHSIALLVALAALVLAVVRARGAGGFPLATLARRWFRRRPPPGLWLVAAVAGLASVVVAPLLGVATGWARFVAAGPVSPRWLALAAGSVGVKAVFVLLEELVFRGALVSELRRRTGPGLAVATSALVFAAAHGERSPLDAAILFADGIGFAVAFLATDSLWVPSVWHLSKNVSVWLFLGRGTIDLTPGPFDLRQSGPEWLFGTQGSAGLLDLGVTVAVVALVTWRLARHRSRLPPRPP